MRKTKNYKKKFLTDALYLVSMRTLDQRFSMSTKIHKAEVSQGCTFHLFNARNFGSIFFDIRLQFDYETGKARCIMTAHT